MTVSPHSADSYMPTPINEFARGWKPLLAVAVGIGLGISSILAFTTGIFAIALEKEFGWSRGDILSVALIQTLVFAFLGPVLGRLTDRIGARPVVIASTIGIGVSTASFAFITHNIWTFYVTYAVMLIVSLGTMPPIFARVVSLWFDRRRGLALGLALCTTGISGMLVPSYVQALIGTFGWRVAYVGLGLLPLTISLPCILFFLPRGVGPVDVKGHEHVAEPVIDGLSIGEALRGYRYWLMGVVGFAAGAGLNGLVINFVPLLIDRGLTPTEAVRLFGLFGLFVVVSRLMAGWLLDRLWAPAVGCTFLCMPVIGMMLLVTGTEVNTTRLVLALALIALASGAEFDLIAYLSSRYFGRRNFSALYSGQYAIFAMGAGIAPGVMGFIHDRTGNYDRALYAMALMFAVSAFSLLGMGRQPFFGRSELSGDISDGATMPDPAPR